MFELTQPDCCTLYIQTDTDSPISTYIDDDQHAGGRRNNDEVMLVV
jgi:hypothetical protein